MKYILLLSVLLVVGCANATPPAPEEDKFVMLEVLSVAGDHYLINTEYVQLVRTIPGKCILIILGFPGPVEVSDCNELRKFIRQ